MFSDLNWESLEQRRRHSRLSMMYTIRNNLVDINAGSFIDSSDARTRGQHRLFQERFTDLVLQANSYFPQDNARMERPPSQNSICTYPGCLLDDTNPTDLTLYIVLKLV